jgi:hypothetical protein
MDAQESLVSQYLALECFPRSQRAYSAQHAGVGQLAFGSDVRRRADLTLSMPWDGRPLQEQRQEDTPNSPDCRQHANDDLRLCPPPEHMAGGRRRIAVFNYDGLYYHYGTHATHCVLWQPYHPPLPPGDPENELRRQLAATLSAVEPDHLVVTFQVLTECQLFCSFSNFDPAREIEGCVTPRRPPHMNHDGQPRPMTMRELLHVWHYKDALLGVGNSRRGFTQEQFLKRILSAGENAAGAEDGGFVTIVSGREESQFGTTPDAFGFCMQRGPIDLKNMGNFTRFQAAEMWGDKADANLVKLVENGQTLTRGSFVTTETLGKS